MVWLATVIIGILFILDLRVYYTIKCEIKLLIGENKLKIFLLKTLFLEIREKEFSLFESVKYIVRNKYLSSI